MRHPPFGADIVAFPKAHIQQQVGFERFELMRILDLYGRMVSAGEWRDYAMDFTRDFACFAAFRRTAEVPQMRLEKRPALRGRQGMWALYGEHGQVQPAQDDADDAPQIDESQHEEHGHH